jgi:hypothetical protein
MRGSSDPDRQGPGKEGKISDKMGTDVRDMNRSDP